jgi:hypothetical protein
MNINETTFVLEVEDRLETIQIASELSTSACLDEEKAATKAK